MPNDLITVRNLTLCINAPADLRPYEAAIRASIAAARALPEELADLFALRWHVEGNEVRAIIEFA